MAAAAVPCESPPVAPEERDQRWLVTECLNHQHFHLRLDGAANAIVPHRIELLHRRGRLTIHLTPAMQHDLSAFLVRYETAPRRERAMSWEWTVPDQTEGLKLCTDGLHRWSLWCRQGIVDAEWLNMAADVTEEIERSASVIHRYRMARDEADRQSAAALEPSSESGSRVPGK